MGHSPMRGQFNGVLQDGLPSLYTISGGSSLCYVYVYAVPGPDTPQIPGIHPHTGTHLCSVWQSKVSWVALQPAGVTSLRLATVYYSYIIKI